MSESIYVTTTIPYVNAAPHIGFALELTQADAVARYHRLLGHAVRFQTGTDENAFKNVLSARALGVPVAQFVDANANRFRALSAALRCSTDRFLRTSEEGHRQSVYAFLARVQQEDVYTEFYRGSYCTGCEDFYLARDLDNGRCPDHGATLVEVAERNYFFRLSKYGPAVRELIAQRRIRVLPEAREAEVLQFIDQGLRDISLSRDAARAGGWGIPYPNDATQVVYVWIDALLNYLSGLDFPYGSDVAQYWDSNSSRVHVIGKNVWKFHAVYWPALLLSAGLPVPNQIVVHGFLTSEGKKISKSGGKSTDPNEYIRQLGVDAVRYFLLRYVRPFDDTDFSGERLAAVYQADLANGLGNLVSRVTALCDAANVPGVDATAPPQAPAGFHEHVAAFRYDLALGGLWESIRELNGTVTREAPWAALRAGRLQAAREKLSRYAARLDAIGYWLQPFLPATAPVLCAALRGSRIEKPPSLFPRR
ncbi:MAG: methionine--tRNA ligase [Gemmatimonadaceae bacterium]